MTWTWRLESVNGTQVDPAALDDVAPGDFPSRGDAESWIGEVFADLAERGVDQVILLEDGREVYGPMSLHPET